MIAAIGAWAAKSALMQSPLGGFLKAVPRWVWIVVAVVAIALVAVRWHAGKVADLKTAAHEAGRVEALAAVAARVKRIEAAALELDRAISHKMRSKNREENRRIAVAADDLRLRGPGLARCERPPAVPERADGRVEAGRTGSTAAGPVPDDDWLAVPFKWGVDQLETCDLNRAEVIAWREWHRRWTEEWPKLGAVK
jgi:hypothetical protein